MSLSKDENDELRQMIKESMDAALELFQRDTVKTYADIQTRFGTIDTQIMELKNSIESRAQERANAEVIEARQRLAIAEERVNLLSTQERIQVQAMFTEHADLQSKQLAQKRKEFWDKVLPNVTTGLIMVFAAPIALGVLAGILIFLANVFQVQISTP